MRHPKYSNTVRLKRQKYPPPKVIAIDVDVDGTLILSTGVNRELAEWAMRQHDDGFQLRMNRLLDEQ